MTSQEPLQILFVLDNGLWNLDEALRDMYCAKHPKEPLPNLSAIYESYTNRLQETQKRFTEENKIMDHNNNKNKILYKLNNILLEPDFFKNLSTVPGAREMLQDMFAYEQKFPHHIHIRIVTSLNPCANSVFFQHSNWDFRYIDPVMLSRVLAEKIALVETILGNRQLWYDRLIFIDEVQTSMDKKCILFSDADIVIQPWIHCYSKTNPNQKRILYGHKETNLCESMVTLARQYDISILDQWKKWKRVMQLSLELNEVLPDIPNDNDTSDNLTCEPISFVHGSTDSNDIDRLYLFPNGLPSHTECLRFIQSSGTEDRNLFSVDQSLLFSDRKYVNDAQKGLIDEVNNALFSTYPLHKQEHACPIQEKLQRIVPLKVCMTLLNLLIKVRRADPYREIVVNSLNSWDFETRRKAVASVDYCKIEKKLTDEDIKYCAFRLGQTVLLIRGREVYTKADLCAALPDLKSLIYFQQNNNLGEAARVTRLEHMKILNKYKVMLLRDIGDVVVEKHGSLHLFKMKKGALASNFFHLQCNGLIVDMKDQKLRCMYYGLDNALKQSEELFQNLPDWPTDDNRELEINEPSDRVFPLQIFEYKYTKKVKEPKAKKKEHSKSTATTEVEHTRYIISTLSKFDPTELNHLHKALEKGSTVIANIDFTQLHFHKWFYLFLYDTQTKQLTLSALRDKLTNRLATKDLIQSESLRIHASAK